MYVQTPIDEFLSMYQEHEKTAIRTPGIVSLYRGARTYVPAAYQKAQQAARSTKNLALREAGAMQQGLAEASGAMGGAPFGAPGPGEIMGIPIADTLQLLRGYVQHSPAIQSGMAKLKAPVDAIKQQVKTLSQGRQAASQIGRGPLATEFRGTQQIMRGAPTELTPMRGTRLGGQNISYSGPAKTSMLKEAIFAKALERGKTMWQNTIKPAAYRRIQEYAENMNMYPGAQGVVSPKGALFHIGTNAFWEPGMALARRAGTGLKTLGQRGAEVAQQAYVRHMTPRLPHYTPPSSLFSR